MSKRKLVLFVTLPPALGWKQRLSENFKEEENRKDIEGISPCHLDSHPMILELYTPHRAMHRQSWSLTRIVEYQRAPFAWQVVPRVFDM